MQGLLLVLVFFSAPLVADEVNCDQADNEEVCIKNMLQQANEFNLKGMNAYKAGYYKKALDWFKLSLDVREKILGRKHPDTATSYKNIGEIYRSMGDYPKALAFYNKALAIREKVLGKDHPDTATSYGGIATKYYVLGDYPKALEFYNKALAIREKVLGKEHPHTAISYDNIGGIYDAMGDYPRALEFYNKALVITGKVLGKNHADTARSYTNIGATYDSMGNYLQAYQFTKKAFSIFLINRDKFFQTADSQQKKQFLKANKRFINFLLLHSIHYQKDLLKQKNAKKILNLNQATSIDWLAYKGSVLASENLLVSLAQTCTEPALKKQYKQFIMEKKIFSQLNQNYPVPNEETSQIEIEKKMTKWREDLNAQEEKIAQLEKALIKTDPRYEKEKALQEVKSQDISDRLNKDTLYIDFAKTNAGYYLFTIDHENKVSFTAYSEEDSNAIDAQIKLFQEDIQTFVSSGEMSLALMMKLNKSSKQSLAKLYKRIFNKTLLAKIADKKTLVISPDGALRLLPFEALYDAEKQGGGQYLIESKDIRYIASGKELVRLARQNKGKTNANKAVLFANPDFGGKPSKEAQETRSTVYTPNTDASKTMGTLSLSPKFKALAGTKKEADAIAKVLTLKEILHDYRGNDANEANLLEVKRPSILHIATHGFFLKDIPNPMLKSGLILAGANLSLEANKGDGIVTALDLSGLELQGTDLVVLSACETGKVDPNNTDGISGLTKAFIQAGAKNVVMSLWSVADKETAELMTAFYKAGKEDKQYAKALKQSKLKLLDKGMHPYYWAAFVLSGGD